MKPLELSAEDGKIRVEWGTIAGLVPTGMMLGGKPPLLLSPGAITSGYIAWIIVFDLDTLIPIRVAVQASGSATENFFGSDVAMLPVGLYTVAAGVLTVTENRAFSSYLSPQKARAMHLLSRPCFGNWRVDFEPYFNMDFIGRGFNGFPFSFTEVDPPDSPFNIHANLLDCFDGQHGQFSDLPNVVERVTVQIEFEGVVLRCKGVYPEFHPQFGDSYDLAVVMSGSASLELVRGNVFGANDKAAVTGTPPFQSPVTPPYYVISRSFNRAWIYGGGSGASIPVNESAEQSGCVGPVTAFCHAAIGITLQSRFGIPGITFSAGGSIGFGDGCPGQGDDGEEVFPLECSDTGESVIEGFAGGVDENDEPLAGEAWMPLQDAIGSSFEYEVPVINEIDGSELTGSATVTVQFHTA